MVCAHACGIVACSTAILMKCAQLGRIEEWEHKMALWVFYKFSTHYGCFYDSLTGKVLIIGGSIANFTNVAATFKVSLPHFQSRCLYAFIPKKVAFFARN